MRLASGEALRNKGFQVIPAGDRLIVEMPGGGGMGDPQTREPGLVAGDVRAGLVTRESAARDYKVAVREDGSIDAAQTARLRERST